MKASKFILLLTSVGVLYTFAEEIMFIEEPKRLYDIVAKSDDLADRSLAYAKLENRAREGNADAKYYLAELFVTGKTGEGGPDFAKNRNGFPPNRPEAYRLAIPLYEDAADHNHILANLKLAGLYAEGKYVSQDADKSLAYLIKAAKLGDKTALAKLSDLYSKDLAGANDREQKFVAVKTLAEAGFPDAQLELSKRLISENSFDEAKHFVIPLAQNGNPSAVALLNEIQQKEESARLAKQKAHEEAARLAAREAEEDAALRRSQEQVARNPDAHRELPRIAEMAAAARKEQANAQSSPEGVATASAARVKEGDRVSSLFGFIIVCGLLLSIPGSILGFQKKIIVYDSMTDVAVTGISLVCLPILTGVSFFLGGALLAVIGFLSWRANKSFWKVLLAVPAKFVLLIIILLCGIIAVGGALGTAEALEKKQYKKAGEMAAAGIGGAIGFRFSHKLIDHLITTGSTARSQR